MRSMSIQAILIVLTFTAISLVGNMNPARGDATSQPAATQPTTAPVAINWDQASKHVGETVVVTGPVVGTHVTTGGKALVLNIGKDYPDPTRFSVMIKTDEQNPANEAKYMGKTITATGKIELYRKAPEVKVNPADVTIAANATTQP